MAGLSQQSLQNAKTADWLVEAVDIELAAHHAVTEPILRSKPGTGFLTAETPRAKEDPNAKGPIIVHLDTRL
jgi:hypothetical protein